MALLDDTLSVGQAGHTADHQQAWKKLNQRVSPAQDFGADPTGSADSTVAIQAALDAAGDGGWVDFGRGSYKVTDQGSGWCLDISAHDSIRLSGSGNPRLNPSGVGGQSAVIYTTQSGKQILRAVSPSGQNHAGPLLENLRIEDRGGNGTGFYVDSVLHGTLFNVEFHGAGSGTSTSGYGMQKLNTNGDASYWTYYSCGALKNFIGFSLEGTDHFHGGYIGSDIVNAIGLEIPASTGNFTCSQTKFEFRGASSAVTGCKGVSIDGASNDISLCTFEGVYYGIYLEDLGSPTNTGTQLVGNMFTGQAGTETNITVGTNHQNTNIIGYRSSNVATMLVDNGSGTQVMAPRTVGEIPWIASLNGVGLLEGSGSPVSSVPNGSIYLRSNGSGSTDNLYIRRGGAWVGIA